MTHRICAALVAALAAFVLSPSAAPPAHAEAKTRPIDEGGDYRKCVTEDEFLTIHPMTPMNRVQRVFDTKGTRLKHGSPQLDTLAGFIGSTIRRGTIVRVYPACDDYPGFHAVVEFGTHSPKKRVTFAYFGG